MTWRNHTMKVEEEDNFTLTLPDIPNKYFDGFLAEYERGARLFGAIIYAIPYDDCSQPDHKNRELEKLEKSKESLKITSEWYRFLCENQRETITGGEYWELIYHIGMIRDVCFLGKYPSISKNHLVISMAGTEKTARSLNLAFLSMKQGFIDPIYNNIELERLAVDLGVEF